MFYIVIIRKASDPCKALLAKECMLGEIEKWKHYAAQLANEHREQMTVEFTPTTKTFTVSPTNMEKDG